MTLPTARHSHCFLAAAMCLAAATAQDPARKPERLDPQVSCTASCHQDLVKVGFVHKPVADGKCVDCHKQEKPTEHTFAEFDDISEGCRKCHTIKAEAVVHSPFESMDCTTCHDPHHSELRPLLKGKDETALCSICHAPIKAAIGMKFGHGPAAEGMCTACHKGHTSEQPKLLAAEPVELCGRCHSDVAEAVENAESVHAPVTLDCSPCHDPHGSDHEHGLKNEVPALCYGCHQAMAEAVGSAKTVHGALGADRKCFNCHLPHESKHKKLLLATGKDGCVQCHQKPQPRAGGGKPVAAVGAEIADYKLPHGPVKDGDCTACHKPHVSPHPNLLGKAFPPRFYASFDVASYELCFGCHDQKAFEAAKTTDATGFRDGDRNLHFLHVNKKDKGRSCRACHEMHGGNTPRHVAATVAFGEWQLPIRWEQQPQGGSCAPGCHKPVTYSREARPPAEPTKK